MDYTISAIVDTNNTLSLDGEINFEPVSSHIKKVTIKSSGDTLRLTSIVRADSEEDAIQKFELSARQITSTLSISARIPVIEVHLSEVSFMRNEKLQLRDWARVKATSHISITLGEDGLRELGNILEPAVSNPLDDRILSYKQSRKETEPALRYLGLYDILEREFGGSRGVDGWLVKNSKASYTHRCPQRGGRLVDETGFTHIRHCLHHPNHGQVTPQEVESGVDALDTIVREYIADKIPWLKLLL